MVARVKLTKPWFKVDKSGRKIPYKHPTKAAGNGHDKAAIGRHLGSVNRASLVMRERFEASGQLPLEFLVELYRTGKMPGAPGQRKITISSDMRFEAAKAAAPYLHPKIMGVHIKQDSPLIPYDLSKLANLPAEHIQIANQVLGVIFGGAISGQPLLDMKANKDDPTLYAESIGANGEDDE